MKTTTKAVKTGTKGQRQIAADNIDTLNYYRNMVFVANAVYFVVMMVFSAFSPVEIGTVLLSGAAYTGCYQFMCFMARAKYDDSGHLTDSGVDLNMEGGISEHVKDVIILTAICQVLSLYSNYFWLLWLAIPGRAFMLLWKNILSPYFFQQAPEEPEMDEKKQKKMERKMKRQNR